MVSPTLFQTNNTHTHTRITALCPGLPGWAGTRKVKPIWILLKQETVSGSGISWDICKSAPHSRQITMPAPHCSVQTRGVHGNGEDWDPMRMGIRSAMGWEWEGMGIKCMGMGVKTWELSPATVNSLLFLHSNME